MRNQQQYYFQQQTKKQMLFQQIIRLAPMRRYFSTRTVSPKQQFRSMKSENQNRSFLWLFDDPKTSLRPSSSSSSMGNEELFEKIPKSNQNYAQKSINFTTGAYSFFPELSSLVQVETAEDDEDEDNEVMMIGEPNGISSLEAENRLRSIKYVNAADNVKPQQVGEMNYDIKVICDTGKLNMPDEVRSLVDKWKNKSIKMMNRNARAPKKANRGRRPCSHVARRSKRMKRHKGW